MEGVTSVTLGVALGVILGVVSVTIVVLGMVEVTISMQALTSDSLTVTGWVVD